MRLPFVRGLPAEGLFFATLFLALSLTPSLVPRGAELQGALGGIAGAAGYAIWKGVAWTWCWLELPVPGHGGRRRLRRAFTVSAILILGLSVWRAADWQNSVREAWGLPTVDTISPLTVALVAVIVFAILILLGRLFGWLVQRSGRWLDRHLPRKIAYVAALVLAVVVFTTLLNGILLQGVLRVVDGFSRAADALIEPDLAAPVEPGRPGSPASLIAWEDMGRLGRHFVASAPTAEEISAFWDAPAHEPLRVYAGLTAAWRPEDRVRLAFDELLRTGGFERDILVIAVPTGSGWLDAGSHDVLDFMHRGDVATVAVQYSYLASWVSLLVDPSHGIREAQALFDLVYAHWTTLPAAERPHLYLHGLSLGAFLSQSTVPLLDVWGDPIDGAMWAGSPFLSEFWRFVVDRREAGSPAWRPRFGNGTLIRSMNQDGFAAGDMAADWGPTRLVFLQYASDPIVFFDTSLAFDRPDWLTGARGPDVSAEMRWIPVVTMLQVGLDMAVSLGTKGYGHDYIAEHYIPAWAEVTEPDDWSEEREAALRTMFRDRPNRWDIFTPEEAAIAAPGLE
jgi:uncharacterized membrane protein